MRSETLRIGSNQNKINIVWICYFQERKKLVELNLIFRIRRTIKNCQFSVIFRFVPYFVYFCFDKFRVFKISKFLIILKDLRALKVLVILDLLKVSTVAIEISI